MDKDYSKLATEALKRFMEDTSAVKEHVSNLKTDVALIKATSENMLDLIKRMDETHSDHRVETNTRFTDCEKRISVLERKQDSWTGYIGGIVISASVVYALLKLIH